MAFMAFCVDSFGWQPDHTATQCNISRRATHLDVISGDLIQQTTISLPDDAVWAVDVALHFYAVAHGDQCGEHFEVLIQYHSGDPCRNTLIMSSFLYKIYITKWFTFKIICTCILSSNFWLNYTRNWYPDKQYVYVNFYTLGLAGILGDFDVPIPELIQLLYHIIKKNMYQYTKSHQSIE